VSKVPHKVIETNSFAELDAERLREIYNCNITFVKPLNGAIFAKTYDEHKKNIEKQLGIKRSQIVDKFYGGDALSLWRMYRATGDDYYLNLLAEYNEYDIINLKIVAEHCVKKMKENLFNSHFASNALARHPGVKNDS